MPTATLLAALCLLVSTVAAPAIGQEATTMKIHLTAGGKGHRGDAAGQCLRARLPCPAAFDADARRLRRDREDRLSAAEALHGRCAGRRDPSPGDIAYYAPWGSVAIFYKDAPYADRLVNLGRIDSGMEVLSARGSLDATIESRGK